MPRLRGLLAGALLAGALGVPAADAALPQQPCVALPTVATTRPSVVVWHTLTGGPWIAPAHYHAVTVECSVYIASSPGDGTIGSASTTTPGFVGATAGLPFGAAAGADLLVCTRVTFAYLDSEFTAYHDCAVQTAG